MELQILFLVAFYCQQPWRYQDVSSQPVSEVFSSETKLRHCAAFLIHVIWPRTAGVHTSVEECTARRLQT